jgi:hypothetical protein
MSTSFLLNRQFFLFFIIIILNFNIIDELKLQPHKEIGLNTLLVLEF